MERDTSSGRTSRESLVTPPMDSAACQEALPDQTGHWSRQGENGEVQVVQWDPKRASRGESSTHNFSELPNAASASSLSQILVTETDRQEPYYLSRKAKDGILRRAVGRGKVLPGDVQEALALGTLVIPVGGIVIPVPSVDDLEEQESHTKHSEDRGDWRNAVGSHRGAAVAIFLESHRSGGSSRPVDLGQLIALLRNSGHRVEQLNPQLFRFDGKSATMADLVERAQAIDADAVLVAEAA